MPTDPKTGERLPYAGEPGAAPDAPPAPGEPETLVPSRDIKPLTEEVEQILAMAERGETPEGAPEEAPGGEEAPPEGEAVEGEEDVTVIAETLGIDQSKAQELWDAAQAMPATQDLTPEELANKLVDDFDLRMKLEKLAAGEMEQAEMAQATEQFAADQGVTPEGMPLPPGQ